MTQEQKNKRYLPLLRWRIPFDCGRRSMRLCWMLLKCSGKSSTHGNIRKADENQRKQLKELLGYYVKISA